MDDLGERNDAWVLGDAQSRDIPAAEPPGYEVLLAKPLLRPIYDFGDRGRRSIDDLRDGLDHGQPIGHVVGQEAVAKAWGKLAGRHLAHRRHNASVRRVGSEAGGEAAGVADLRRIGSSHPLGDRQHAG